MNPHCLEIAQGSKIAFSPLSIKPHLLQLEGKFPYFFYNVEGGKMNTKKIPQNPTLSSSVSHYVQRMFSVQLVTEENNQVAGHTVIPQSL